jgi:hypothetical protein
MPTNRKDYSLKSYEPTKISALLAELQSILPGYSVECKKRKFDSDVLSGRVAVDHICQCAAVESDLNFCLKGEAIVFDFRFFQTGDLFIVFCTSEPTGLSKIDNLHDAVATALALLPPTREELESTVNLYDLNQRVVRVLKVVERWDGATASLDLFQRKKCFVSFHFDEHGAALAYELRDFLEIIGIQFVSGQGYEPRPVSSKVLSRLDHKIDLFIVIFSREENVDWLQQEVGIAKGRGIPIMVLVEGEVRFASGILADHEYVRFPVGTISKAFFPLIQALRFLENSQ